MSKEVISGFYNSEGKRNYSIAGIVDTSNGESLSIAIVSEELSISDRDDQQLTEAASNAIIAFIQNSSEENYSKLLYQAVSYANKVIYEQYVRVGRSCTLAVAIINPEGRAYIANVGSSRIYLARRSKLSQLSLNHTVMNLLPIQEKLMLNHDRVEFAQDLFISIGSQPSVPVDIGFHFPEVSCKEEYLEAQARGKVGLLLREGDSIVLSSQDLNPIRPDDRNALSYLKKITATLLGKRGDQAAKSLSFLSLIRDPISNSSIAVLQIPFSPQTSSVWNVRKFLNRYAGAVAGALMTLLIFMSLTVSSITVMAWNHANGGRSSPFTASAPISNSDAAGTLAAGEAADGLQNSQEEPFDLSPMVEPLERPAIVSEDIPGLTTFTRIRKILPESTATDAAVEYKAMIELFPQYGVETIETPASIQKEGLVRNSSRTSVMAAATPEVEEDQVSRDVNGDLFAPDPLLQPSLMAKESLLSVVTSDQEPGFHGIESREVTVRLNLRLGPSTDREIIGLLLPREQFETYYRFEDETGDIWLLGGSERSGQIGWVWGNGTDGGEYRHIPEFLPMD